MEGVEEYVWNRETGSSKLLVDRTDVLSLNVGKVISDAVEHDVL